MATDTSSPPPIPLVFGPAHHVVGGVALPDFLELGSQPNDIQRVYDLLGRKTSDELYAFRPKILLSP